MKHFTILLVAVLVFNHVAVPQATQTQGASQAAKVKTEVQKRGIGEKSRVKVRLRNKEEVKGYISKIEDASFDVIDKKTGRATTIPLLRRGESTRGGPIQRRKDRHHRRCSRSDSCCGDCSCGLSSGLLLRTDSAIAPKRRISDGSSQNQSRE
jgi:hypothetical protein